MIVYRYSMCYYDIHSSSEDFARFLRDYAAFRDEAYTAAFRRCDVDGSGQIDVRCSCSMPCRGCRAICLYLLI